MEPHLQVWKVWMFKKLKKDHVQQHRPVKAFSLGSTPNFLDKGTRMWDDLSQIINPNPLLQTCQASIIAYLLDIHQTCVLSIEMAYLLILIYLFNETKICAAA